MALAVVNAVIVLNICCRRITANHSSQCVPRCPDPWFLTKLLFQSSDPHCLPVVLRGKTRLGEETSADGRSKAVLEREREGGKDGRSLLFVMLCFSPAISRQQ